LLLDDIINVANQAVQDGVTGIEGFLQKWTDQRAEKLGGDWNGTQEVKRGLVAFVDEIEQLRRKINAVLLPLAIHSSAAQRRQSERRCEQPSVLEHPSLATLASFPAKLEAIHGSCSSSESLDANAVATLAQVEFSEPGKRPWESTTNGYLKWVTDRLLARAKQKDGGRTQVTDLVERVDAVGYAERLREAIEVTENVQQSLGGTGKDGGSTKVTDSVERVDVVGYAERLRKAIEVTENVQQSLGGTGRADLNVYCY
ncbi:hypothetical protein AN958_04554, partial [Leucoagaricus sp. SymC.cos]